MRATVLVLLLSLIAPNVLTAEAHGPYNQNVRDARTWLKKRTTDRQFKCADILWDNESHWNPRSGEVWKAYGIPQAYPGHKMASAGSDWKTNATTQVKWGKSYVRGRYGTFCNALRFQDANGWY